MTRRTVLGGALGVSAAPFATNSLAQAARRSGLAYGCAVNLTSIEKDGDLTAAILREADAVTPELEMKWAALEPQAGVLDFSRLDALAGWARRNGKAMRGHALLWRKSLPAWAADALRTNPDWLLVHRFMASVMPRYGDLVHTWDVVNEPLGEAGLADSFRDAFGDGYVRRALESARVFAPRGRLAINEYGLEYAKPEHRARRQALVELVHGLKAAGAPLDQVGLQSHLDLSQGPLDETGLLAMIDDLAATGVSLAITELDVKEADYAASPQVRDAAVADAVRDYLDLVLSRAAVVSVTTWGISDRSSWLAVTDADRRRFPGAWTDGSSPGANRGLPLAADLSAKPFRTALRTALAERGRTAASRPW